MTAAPPRDDPAPGDLGAAIRPRRDAVVAAALVLTVSAAGLGVTYYFARQSQLEAVQNELLQIARIAAARIDGDAHRRIDAPEKELTPEYRRVLAPLVDVQKAAVDVFYVYTAVADGPRVRYVLDTASVYRVPGDTEPYVRVMEEYLGSDVEFRRAVTTQSLQVNAQPDEEPERTYLSAYAPFYDSSGAFVGVVGVDMWVHDLERRRARLLRVVIGAATGLLAVAVLTGAGVYRLRVLAAAAEVRDRRQLRALAEARDLAEQSSRAKSAFLATMSHELRTPLNAIVGYSDLLHEQLVDRGDTTLATDVNRIRTASHHLTAVISGILDYSKMEAGRLELSVSTVDLGHLATDLVELFRPAAARKALSVTLHRPAGALVVAGDPVRLRQVLLNLIDNAIKFTEHGGVIVRVRPSPTSTAAVVCTVHDTGIGVPAHLRARLFKPFSQLDSSPTRAAGGTGLGLAISLRLVEMMHGTLRMRSRVGHGTTFRVSIPAKTA